MPFNIDVLSLGGDFDRLISEARQLLNGSQDEFVFHSTLSRLRSYGRNFVKADYKTQEVFEYLKGYRRQAKGSHPYIIGVIDCPLQSKKKGNLFGSHNARDGEGEAVITLKDHELFTDSPKLYLTYYLIRYALSFVCPELKNHDDTRGCFFDAKNYKPDLQRSIDSGGFCQQCSKVLWDAFNEEINLGIQNMVRIMKALRASSQDVLPAKSLRRQVDIGIITIREDEFEAMRDRFLSHRNVSGRASYYSYSEVKLPSGRTIRVAIVRSPGQGQGPAQSVAFNMIDELGPSWIFVVGIAGGFPAAEYTLGDVLLSQRMHDFAVSAAIEGKEPEFQDMGGPMTREVEKLVTGLKGFRGRLGQWAEKQFLGKVKPNLKPPKSETNKSLYGNEAWRSKVIGSLNTQFPNGRPLRAPDFFAAVIVTGNTLLKDTKLAALWRRTARHASGVEMELGGVCQAARFGTDGRTHVLAIRGISDIVGYKRSTEWTDFACRSAAAFADALIRSDIIDLP